MRQFFCPYIRQRRFTLFIRHGIPLGQVTHAGAELSIGTAELLKDRINIILSIFPPNLPCKYFPLFRMRRIVSAQSVFDLSAHIFSLPLLFTPCQLLPSRLFSILSHGYRRLYIQFSHTCHRLSSLFFFYTVYEQTRRTFPGIRTGSMRIK